jgi:hypothetical protein
MYMPIMPEAIEHAAPTRNATDVINAIGRPARVGTSATSFVSTKKMTRPITTEPTTASTAIVVY